MRAEWRLVADVLLAILVHPVAQRSFVHAEFPCDLSDRARPVDHQPHGLIPELGTELAVLPCHSLHHLPGQILLDRGPRTTGHLTAVERVWWPRLLVSGCPGARAATGVCRAAVMPSPRLLRALDPGRRSLGAAGVGGAAARTGRRR